MRSSCLALATLALVAACERDPLAPTEIETTWAARRALERGVALGDTPFEARVPNDWVCQPGHSNRSMSKAFRCEGGKTSVSWEYEPYAGDQPLAARLEAQLAAVRGLGGGSEAHVTELAGTRGVYGRQRCVRAQCPDPEYTGWTEDAGKTWVLAIAGNCDRFPCDEALTEAVIASTTRRTAR